MALASDRPATLATYRMELGDKWIPVKNIYVPLVDQGPPLGQFRARLPRRLTFGRRSKFTKAYAAINLVFTPLR